MTRSFGVFFAGALVGALLLAIQMSGKIDVLEDRNYELSQKNKSCSESVTKQNTEIEELKSYAEKKADAYEDLLAKPESVRWRIEYRELKSNDCKDIKAILDDIRNSGF